MSLLVSPRKASSLLGNDTYDTYDSKNINNIRKAVETLGTVEYGNEQGSERLFFGKCHAVIKAVILITSASAI